MHIRTLVHMKKCQLQIPQKGRQKLKIKKVQKINNKKNQKKNKTIGKVMWAPYIRKQSQPCLSQRAFRNLGVFNKSLTEFQSPQES